MNGADVILARHRHLGESAPTAACSRYNIAPSQPVETIINDGTELWMGPMQSGYTTSVADKTKPAPINALAETITSSSMFREAF